MGSSSVKLWGKDEVGIVNIQSFSQDNVIDNVIIHTNVLVILVDAMLEAGILMAYNKVK